MPKSKKLQNPDNNQKKQTDNNRELYRIMYLFSGLFLLLCAYLSWFLIFESKEVINNPYNLRQENFEQKIIRGKILSADGEILAETVVADDGTETRSYPYQELFAHTVGYSQNGKTGMEQRWNFELLTSDIPFYEKAYLEFYNKKAPGNQIVTTFSTQLQQTAREALGEHKGAVVALEPSTGKLLAMVSAPDFDPNTVVSDWDTLTGNTDGILLNRATLGLYPPGSTFKLLTALAYIREYPKLLEDFTYDCNGIFSYHNAEINCYHGNSHGKLNFTEAFAKSCNGAFAKIGTILSIPDFSALCQSFLFNTELPCSLPYEQSSFALTSESPDWEIMQTAIGQGQTSLSPLHNALIAAAVANGGILMKPYAVTEVQNAYGETVKQYLPSVYQTLMTPGEASILTGLMTACVTEGTGYGLQTDAYTAAGKTGTADWSEDKKPHAWFIGFAPADNPRIVVSIIVEESGTGSEYAIPIARRMFDAYFSSQNP